MFQQSNRIVGASVSAALTVPPLRNVHSIRVVATIRDTSRVEVTPCHYLPVGGDVMKMRIGMLTVDVRGDGAATVPTRFDHGEAVFWGRPTGRDGIRPDFGALSGPE